MFILFARRFHKLISTQQNFNKFTGHLMVKTSKYTWIWALSKPENIGAAGSGNPVVN